MLSCSKNTPIELQRHTKYSIYAKSNTALLKVKIKCQQYRYTRRWIRYINRATSLFSITEKYQYSCCSDWYREATVLRKKQMSEESFSIGSNRYIYIYIYIYIYQNNCYPTLCKKVHSGVFNNECPWIFFMKKQFIVTRRT